MIRLLLKTTFRDSHNGCEGTEYTTHDIEDADLEAMLTQGGRSEDAHLRTELIGAEIREQNAWGDAPGVTDPKSK